MQIIHYIFLTIFVSSLTFSQNQRQKDWIVTATEYEYKSNGDSVIIKTITEKNQNKKGISFDLLRKNFDTFLLPDSIMINKKGNKTIYDSCNYQKNHVDSIHRWLTPISSSIYIYDTKGLLIRYSWLPGLTSNLSGTDCIFHYEYKNHKDKLQIPRRDNSVSSGNDCDVYLYFDECNNLIRYRYVSPYHLTRLIVIKYE